MSRSCMERSSNMPRTGDEAFVWRVGVVGGQARRIERTEGTVVYQALCLSVTGIEASLEAHLHDRPGKLRPIRHGFGLLRDHRYRVLAKHWQTGVETGADQRGVLGRRGGNHRGSEPGPDHPFDGLIPPANLLRHRRCPPGTQQPDIHKPTSFRNPCWSPSTPASARRVRHLSREQLSWSVT